MVELIRLILHVLPLELARCTARLGRCGGRRPTRLHPKAPVVKVLASKVDVSCARLKEEDQYDLQLLARRRLSGGLSRCDSGFRPPCSVAFLGWSLISLLCGGAVVGCFAVWGQALPLTPKGSEVGASPSWVITGSSGSLFTSLGRFLMSELAPALTIGLTRQCR